MLRKGIGLWKKILTWNNFALVYRHKNVFILSNFYTYRSHLIQKPILLMKIFSLENLNQLIWFKWPDWMSKSIRESSLFIRWVLFLKLFSLISVQTNFQIIHMNLGPHFLCWISGVVPFNTWPMSSWEENKWCYKLSQCTKWHLFHLQRLNL